MECVGLTSRSGLRDSKSLILRSLFSLFYYGRVIVSLRVDLDVELNSPWFTETKTMRG